VVLDGDDLISHTSPTARRLGNLRSDPRINVVVVDPDNPRRYVEVRGTATLREGAGEHLRDRFKTQAKKYGLSSEAGEIGDGVEVVQIRVTPSKVNYFDFGPNQMGPAAAQRRPDNPVPTIVADGRVYDDEDGRWIEFERPAPFDPDAVWAALTEPSRLVLWQHPVEFLPDLRLGATIHAQLNPQAKAFALGKVIELDAPHRFAFRWTTTNPQLPPEFVISYEVTDGTLRVRSGPFGPNDGVLLLAASFHIHLDHLTTAITASEAELPIPPWPEISVVTRSGMMQAVARQYAAKYQ
jgi:uncharacterized protein YndB with AHSA1/START domain